MQVKAVLRTLRKKANKAAREALSIPSAYGELMTVTRPGAKPSSHARKLLEGDAWARQRLDNGRVGKVFSCPGFKFAAAHMFDLLGDDGHPPQKLALQPAQLAFLLMWGRKLLHNQATLPRDPGPKQKWQVEYDRISAKVASTRNNTSIDYTGWPALSASGPARAHACASALQHRPTGESIWEDNDEADAAAPRNT
ncbi:hypothetical protein CVIRNUC_001673 [Coccomyxa viridis]|uniref:Uncharacterized protein n=1 Tax=Coccomyxa viridis TaxID=1274662 RepID=A0AAV1HU08_9CHLO|nr:hypothetical protein CVIRNUC_001673 [Coccomyxa viridis]